MKEERSINSSTKIRLTIAGLLFFLAGVGYFMGISTAQSFYPLLYDVKNSSICELSLPNQPSAMIFNITMIITGILTLISACLIYSTFKKYFLSLFILFHGLGMLFLTIILSNPWHMLLTIFVFVSGGIAVIIFYKVIDSSFRYVFLCLGIISLVFLLFYFNISPIIGRGGAESWIIYPQVFSMMGFGAYLIGLQVKR